MSTTSPSSSPAPPPPSTPTPAAKTKNALPPGMVIGPDGKPCKICTAFRNVRRTKQTGKASSNSNSSTGSKTAATMAAFATGTTASTAASSPTPSPTASTEAASSDVLPSHCPPDVELLGRSTWTFLHTTAAYYPLKPTPTQRANMLSLLRSLPLLYPCSNCALDFGEDMKVHPPDVSGRVGLSRWLCERHNEVNGKLGKERFECTEGKLGERWRDGPGDGSCE